MNPADFDQMFAQLTGNPPFPWQRALYVRFTSDRGDNIPASCNLPTGLGKTSVVAVLLTALATRPDKIPRRLVYVVNRWTVVDQTTDEAERLQRNAEAVGVPRPVISTLRGQFADNRKWPTDPSRPAVVVGTVDMIGSRLLFSGYGVGFKGKPLHAGFLGQDVLLVHDEAHLEPAFQDLLIAVEKEQQRCNDFGTFRVMELSATFRGRGEPFGLSDADHENATVMKRIGAKKAIHLLENKDEKKLADELAILTLEHKDSERAVLVFVRRVDDVDKVTKKLPKDSFEQLTGTLRGLERDALVKNPIFQRFLPESNRDKSVTPNPIDSYFSPLPAGERGARVTDQGDSI